MPASNISSPTTQVALHRLAAELENLHEALTALSFELEECALVLTLGEDSADRRALESACSHALAKAAVR